jgi:hypothetical protein
MQFMNKKKGIDTCWDTVILIKKYDYKLLSYYKSLYCTMLAITTISPSHKNFDVQKQAIDSWVNAGYKVISVNCKKEIEQLTDFKNVEFVETDRTNQVLFGKPFVLISSIIDHLKVINEEYALIINSDIIIECTEAQTQELKRKSENGIIILNRHDFKESIINSKRYEVGFDGFFINKKWLYVFPQSILCLGQCFWDYWIPYVCVLQKIPIFKDRGKYLYHKMHDIQYSFDNWKTTADIFKAELSILEPKLGSHTRPDKMSDYVFNRIKNHLL